MGKTDWNVEVMRLANGELSFDEGLAMLRPADPAASQFGVFLARLADAEQAEALVAAIHQCTEPTPAIQYGVGTELVRSGFWKPVLAERWIGSLVVEFMVAATQVNLPDRAAFFAAAGPQLAAALDDPDANPLSILGAKRFIQDLPPDLRDHVLDWLTEEVQADKADGFFDDLMYEHGQVDPMIELALCLIEGGRVDEGVAFLEARHSESPAMMHLAELEDVLAVFGALPKERRETWGQRFTSWAAATTTPEGLSLGAEWLRRTSR